MSRKPKKTAEIVTGYRVEAVSIDDVRPYTHNARVHSADQIDEIVASIREFGWTNPLLVDVGADFSLVAGHGRLAAAKKLYGAGGVIRLPDGRELPPGTVPVVDCSGWSEAQRRAYILADNRIAENATWDEALLKIELGQLLDGGTVDAGLLGFGKDDLAKIFADPSASGEGSDPTEEWKGMPEFDQKDKSAFRSIPVHFANQEAVDAFAALIGQKITDRTRFVWYPEIQIERYADKRYGAEDA
jgi:hypothetical protein